MLAAKQDIASNLIIQQLLPYNNNFLILSEDRLVIKSKYIHQVIRDGLIPKTQIDGDHLFEYESIDLLKWNSFDKAISRTMAKCSSKEVHVIDSFVIQSFDSLRALGNQRVDGVFNASNCAYWRERAGEFWKPIELEAGAWFEDILERGWYSLFDMDFASIQHEKANDSTECKSQFRRMASLFIETFCGSPDKYGPFRLYTAAHLGSRGMYVNRDEMIVAINDFKICAIYIYKGRCYG